MGRELIEWYHDIGTHIITEETAPNRLATLAEPVAPAEVAVNATQEAPKAAAQAPQTEPKPAASASPPAPVKSRPNAAVPTSQNDIVAQARALADQATSRAELEQIVHDFDGCALKRTASRTVFCDGNPKSQVMLIGEAPGASEDEQGIPFCGQSGQLLDIAIASIGLSRKENCYISNSIFWRPPGNRRPTNEEIAICKPFVEKHIALINPKLLILVGGTAIASVLSSKDGISKLRGSFHDYTNPYISQPIKTTAIFHPAFLLRSPGQKRALWLDLMKIEQFLMEQAK